MTDQDDKTALSNDRVLALFLERYWKDHDAGRPTDLLGYLSAFPNHQELIADEHAALRQGDSVSSTQTSPPGDGGQLGPYRIQKELGRGGQGIVYKAEDTRLNRIVALKVLTGLGPGSEETVQRFRREAEVASKLNHPGICAVLDAGVHDGVPFMAMQYVEGDSLAEKIAGSEASAQTSIFSSFDDDEESGRDDSGKPSSSTTTKREILEILTLFEKAARAIHAAHEAGVVHRDIKPGNIMVTEEGDPILLDFGLARSDDMDLQTLTRTGDLFGTPAYMSPEQLMGQRLRLDRRTDVYSLGASLFECLTLKRPFEAATREALYQQIMTRDASDPRKLNPHVPPELKVVLETALEKDRDRRYQTAADFADDLARVRKLEPIAAKPASAWLRSKRWAQRNPVVATLSAALLLFLSAGLAWTASKNRELDRNNSELDRERNAARAALTDVERLSDARVLDDLEERAEKDLWPAVPDKLDAMRTWRGEAEALVARIPTHRAKLAALRARSIPYDDEQRRDDWASELARIAELEAQRSDLEDRIEDASERDADRIEDELDEVEEELDELRVKVKTQRNWRFASTEDSWMHELLSDLVRRLDALIAENGALADVDERVVFAEGLKKRTIDDHAALWRKTIDGIRKSDKYPALRVTGLEPQIGLIPLGSDPASKLYEFLHLASHKGPLPERDSNGVLQRTEQTGIILVLIPGGRFDMGAERDPASTNHDPDARQADGPVHSVTLSPFFLSKYEMTQGQWARVQSGAKPSYYGAGKGTWGNRPVTPLHPVEHVNWAACDRALMQIDLVLPMEAQWEYAARAQTSSVWSTGSDVTSLKGAANIADSGSAHLYPRSWYHEQNFEDGYAVHAPVGSLDANAFGLHDVHGNVWEWCRDLYCPYADGNLESGTGLRQVPGSRYRVYRGGSFSTPATDARSAYRTWRAPVFCSNHLGLRPARTCRSSRSSEFHK